MKQLRRSVCVVKMRLYETNISENVTKLPKVLTGVNGFVYSKAIISLELKINPSIN